MGTMVQPHHTRRLRLLLRLIEADGAWTSTYSVVAWQLVQYHIEHYKQAPLTTESGRARLLCSRTVSTSVYSV